MRSALRRAQGFAVAAAWLVAVAGPGLLPSRASAMAGDGALLTNLVSSTYNGAAGVTVQFQVSYAATALVLIQCPVVAIVKRGDVTVQNTGGSVTFTLCVVNSSPSASALNVVLTDRLPDNTTYANQYTTWGAVAPTNFYAANLASAWTAGQPPVGQGAPYYMRWVFTPLGPARSACVSYAVRIL